MAGLYRQLEIVDHDSGGPAKCEETMEFEGAST
eukprot:CAMPEP_0115115536 /NCGR_PEP_ID=MMETSP0227-20121206/42752_1 /TAXON_ID=89957 /ORGANISM="Polarella glacialis, Strain CCMP 1383" /LENGTH=32 /DNA_ID= /DNA_START= /DNA_END= /DNA_ORIENTATION=